MSAVRVSVLVASMIGCSEPAPPSSPVDELRAKSWTRLEDRPGSAAMPLTVFFDDHGGMVVTDELAIFRLDTSTRTWSDVGRTPGAWKGGMSADPSGATFYASHQTEPDGRAWERSTTTDPFVWSEMEILGSAEEIHFGRSIYKLFMLLATRGKRLLRLDGDHFTTIRTEVEGTLALDHQGNPLIVHAYPDGATRAVDAIDELGQTTRTLYACDGSSTPLCRNAPDVLFTHADNSITWASHDEVAGSFMNRSLPDSAVPTRYADFPTAHDDVTYDRTLNVAADEQGNMYTVRAGSSTASLFVLYAGTEEWQWVDDTPGRTDFVKVGRDGTLFLFDGAAGRAFYTLE